jgi:hypothetical protein
MQDQNTRVLTEDEQRELEHAIGAGMVEVGGITDVVESACRKLGLNPLDWHGNRMLKEES